MSAAPKHTDNVIILRENDRDRRTEGFFDAWWRETSFMTLEERGAYAEICSYYVQQKKPIHADSARHACRVSTRKWRTLINSLLRREVVTLDEKGALTPNALAGRLYKTGYVYRKDPIPNKLRWQVFQRDGHRCVECGSGEDLTVDHIVAEIRGGKTTLANLQTLCRSCNCRKGARA